MLNLKWGSWSREFTLPTQYSRWLFNRTTSTIDSPEYGKRILISTWNCVWYAFKLDVCHTHPRSATSPKAGNLAFGYTLSGLLLYRIARTEHIRSQLRGSDGLSPSSLHHLLHYSRLIRQFLCHNGCCAGRRRRRRWKAAYGVTDPALQAGPQCATKNRKKRGLFSLCKFFQGNKASYMYDKKVRYWHPITFHFHP